MAYSAGSFSLEIEGQFAGYLTAVEGGEPVAAVVLEPPDAGKVVRKHPGAVSYTPIHLSFDTATEPPVFQWIADMLMGTQSAKNGAVVFYDYNLIEERRIEFNAALITRIAFPELDGASSDVALFRVTLQPDVTHVSSVKAGSKGPPIPMARRRALISNFRLAIGNLPTNRVKQIESMVVSQAFKRDANTVVLQPLEISDLAFSVSEIDEAPMYAWFNDFILAGNGSKEQSGSLNLLDSTLSKTLFALTLSNIGVVKVQRQTQTDGAGLLKLVRVEAYVEQLSVASVQEAGPPREQTPAAALETILQTLSVRSKVQAGGANTSDAGGMKTLDPTAIAQRFRAAPSGMQVRSLHDAGLLVGTQWASQVASLEEARQLADLTSRDWNAVRLEQSHSLVAKLIDDGLLQTKRDGPIDLARDGFTEGVIVGVSRVVQSVSPVLAASAQSLDSLSEMGETESLRLQMAMDRIAKLMATISNILKKMSDTADSITQNMK